MPEEMDVYEGCTMFTKSARPDVLDHLLEINFTHIPAQRVLKRARFIVVADDAVNEWIQTHPTFKRGCWPVGLMNLHQWFWQTKFIEVKGHRELEGGMQDPNVGVVRITAEFEDLDGEGWFVPLVNFANTHLLDQLRQFYNDHPEMCPSPERVSEVMSAEAAKLVATHEATIREQIKRRPLIRRPTSKVRIFVDESGDIGFKRMNDVYTYAAVIVPEAKEKQVSAALRALLTKHWRNTPPSEIHACQLPESKQDAVKNDMAEIILQHDLRLVCFAIAKWNFVKHLCRRHVEARFSQEEPFNISWRELTNDPNYYFKFNFLALTVDEVVSDLAIDFLVAGFGADFFHDRKNKTWMNDALEHGFQQGLETARKHAEAFFGLSIVPPCTFSLADSEKEPCLWLADWVSNELRAWAHHSPHSAAFEKAKPNIIFIGFDSNGVKGSSKEIGGHADQTYPELPREIVRGDPAERSAGPKKVRS
jgi:hypothetical protein